LTSPHRPSNIDLVASPDDKEEEAMASKKAVLAGGKSAELVAALVEGYDLEPAPSKAFGKLRPRGEKRTLCWVIPGAKAVRLHIHADLAQAPKALTKDTWPGAGGAPQLKVTGDNVKQARELLAWIATQAPAKPGPKAKAPTARAAAKKPPVKRARPKATSVVAKRRIHFRTATGDVRTEDVPEAEADSFVESLKAQGAEVVSDKPKTTRRRGSKATALVEAGVASNAKEAREQLADMGDA
jgi:hypothetical protein